MSRSEENESLLANMAENPEGGENLYPDMQAMMGFSSFGGTQKPKRQPRVPGPGKGFGTGANSQPVQPRNSSTSTPKAATRLSGSSQPFVPASLPPRPGRSASKPFSDFTSDAESSRQANPQQVPSTPSTTSTTIPDSTSKTVSSTTNKLVSTPKSIPVFIPNHPSDQAQSENTTPLETPQANQSDLDTTIAYTDPTTSHTLTKHELLAYERGIVESRLNNEGTETQVKVYFKPNFVQENPWEELEIAAGIKKVKK